MKKELIKFGVIFLIIIGVIAWGVNYIFFQNGIKSKAAGETMTLSFSPPTSTVGVNQDFTVSLFVKSSVATQLRGYKTRINFDKTKIAFKYIAYTAGIASSGLGNTVDDIALINERGSIDIVGQDSSAFGSAVSSVNGLELVWITFTSLSASPNSISTSNNDFYTIGSDGSLFNSWTYVDGSLSLNGAPTVAPSGEINLTPTVPPVACTSFSDDFSANTLNTTNWGMWSNNNGTVAVGNGEATLSLPTGSGSSKSVSISKILSGDFSAEITFKGHTTESNKSSSNLFFAFGNSDWSKSFNIAKAYNKQPSELVSGWFAGTTWTNQGVNDGIDHNTPVKVRIERTGATIKMSYDKLDGSGYKLIKQLDDYYSGQGTIAIGIDNWGPDFPSATGTFDDFKLTCAAPAITSTPIPTVTGIITPSPTGVLPSPTISAGNVKLNLELKFQGINKLPAEGENSMLLKAKIYKEGETTPVEGTGMFTAGDDGIWTGTIAVNIPSLTGKFRILLKGRHHIQKKICDAVPTETSPGTYRCTTGNITLVAGDNNLDFSGILLLAGDLDQSGIVDSVDFGLVKNNLGKTDEAALNACDLNRDGRCNTQDFSMILVALGIRTDEQ